SLFDIPVTYVAFRLDDPSFDVIGIATKNILEQRSDFIVLLLRLRQLRPKNPCSDVIACLVGEILEVTFRFFLVTFLHLEFGISQSLPRSNRAEVCRGPNFLPCSRVIFLG